MVLNEINSPQDIKQLNIDKQIELAEEIRKQITDVVTENGGHLASNLGIVEATIALYKAFDFPKDKLVFDVGHQCYAHKILSGRKDAFNTLRQAGGISGFPNREESEFDNFTSGHAGSSIAQGLGLCMARDALKEDYYVINVVGDGSIVNGLNLEAITSKTSKPKKYIVILNDNGMSISKNTNGFYNFFSKRTIGRRYMRGKRGLKRVFKNSFVTKALRGTRDFVKRLFAKTIFFEDYGFKYVGVTDGNNLKELSKTLAKVKLASNDKAILLHIRTVKGKGNAQAEGQADLYHGVGKKGAKKNGFGSKIGLVLNEFIEKDKSILAITAGMKDGTGLKPTAEKYPKNFLDVGISEEYAVTLASGLSRGGLKPVVFMYSTFLQRAYDQIMQDVCLQNLPVIFCIDRAGLVGEDGETHQGVFDLSYLSHMPNMRVYSVCNENELKSAFDNALKLNCPVAIRYPKELVYLDSGDYADGDWTVLGENLCADDVVLAVGGRLAEVALKAKNESKKPLDVYLVKRIKPLDTSVLDKIRNKNVITLEENSVIGGFGSAVKTYYSNSQTKVNCLGVPDRFIKHGDVDYQLEACGLTSQEILRLID